MREVKRVFTTILVAGVGGLGFVLPGYLILSAFGVAAQTAFAASWVLTGIAMIPLAYKTAVEYD